jgi:uncharacterized membrane protein
MRAYVAITGTVFALLVAAHIARVMKEVHLARDPFFLVATAIALVFAIWAGRLLWRHTSTRERT